MPNDSPKPPGTDPSHLPPVPGNAALRAVLTGIGVDICGSTLLGIVLTSVYVAQVETPGMTSAQIEDVVRGMPPQSPLSVLGIVLGALISVAAGYVCARIARRNEFFNGALMAGGVALIGALMSDPGGDDTDLALLMLASQVACNLLGVKYGVARNRRPGLPADPPVDTSAP